MLTLLHHDFYPHTEQAVMETDSDMTMVARNALTQALRSLITHIISESNEGNLTITRL